MQRGYYILILEIKKEHRIKIGKLGVFSFREGLYFYVGRAVKGLRKRIMRHFLLNHPKRWHIDYLTPYATSLGVIFFPLAKGISECTLAKKLNNIGGEYFPVFFGASDCRCRGHLLYFASCSFEILPEVVNAMRDYRLSSPLFRFILKDA